VPLDRLLQGHRDVDLGEVGLQLAEAVLVTGEVALPAAAVDVALVGSVGELGGVALSRLRPPHPP